MRIRTMSAASASAWWMVVCALASASWPAADRRVHAAGPAIDVPRATAPVTIDGRIDDAEWKAAATQRLPDGTVLRFQHDARSLFVGITAARQGFASLCAASGNFVRVLHASAALGSVTYTRAADGWTTTDKEFVYGMRNTELTDAARAERAAYLARHHWVASTAPMGGGRVQELQISLDVISRLPVLALGYYAMGPDNKGNKGTVVGWPASLPSGDGCVDTQLVTGYVPPQLRFDPTQWAAIRIAPTR